MRRRPVSSRFDFAWQPFDGPSENYSACPMCGEAFTWPYALEDAARTEHAGTHPPEAWAKVREHMGVVKRERSLEHEKWRAQWTTEARRLDTWVAAAQAAKEPAAW